MTYTPDQLVKTMTALMPALCVHLENTSAFFQVCISCTISLPHLLTPHLTPSPPNPLPTQAQLVESDGVVDAESSHQDFPALCTTFHLLLKTMAAFFGW